MTASFLTPQGDELWRFITGGRIRSQPAIGKDGIIYIISEDRYLYALNNQGRQLWRCDLHERVSDCFCLGYDGSIYVGLKKGKILAINPKGKIIWEYDIHETLSYSPALHSDGTLFFIGQEGKLIALSHTGIPRFQIKLNLKPSANPATDSDGTLYLPLRQNQIIALYPWGEKKWQLTLKGNPCTPVITSEGTVIVGTDQGLLYAIDPNGFILWTFTFNAEVLYPIIGRNDTIYGILKTSKAFSLSKNGELLWIVQVGKAALSSCSLGSSGTIYLYSGGNFIHALSPTGTIIWSLPIKGELTNPVLADQGILYAGSDNWSLYAFKAEKPCQSPWPQFQHDPGHSSHSLRVIQTPSIEDLYGQNPDFLYLKSLLWSLNPWLIEKGLTEIQVRYDQLAINSSRPYLLYLLAKVASQNIFEINRHYGYPVDGYSAIREQACLLYTLLGGFSARDFLLKLVGEEKDPSMKAVAVRCLGILRSDPEGNAVQKMASIISVDSQNTLDNRIAKEIIQAFRKIAYYHGVLPQNGIKTLLTISNSNYLSEVKELALNALEELK
jgi:outer membrane protein assembly factor BamB